ncbi:BLUF domain-containing protein [Halioglobus maricola]|uniref:BLUF domain-containing protein n=1 Tax=Halioglobus maricola TaxID=2601894 RepID=A0A5P9NKP2_9GAMM|nr:BLUF domain-containing protein [Halioglobus maricola]
MYRLIYKSRSVETLNWGIVRSITSVSENNNEIAGLTGVLLASRTHFLQVIEGNFEDVNAAFQRICKDERHSELCIIGYSIIDARLFGGWGMRGIGAFDFNQKIESELVEKYGEEEGGIHFPLEEWQALAMISDIKMIRDLPEWKK